MNLGDYPVIQAFAIYLPAGTMTVNLIVDLLYKLLTRGEFSNERARPNPFGGVWPPGSACAPTAWA